MFFGLGLYRKQYNKRIFYYLNAKFYQITSVSCSPKHVFFLILCWRDFLRWSSRFVYNHYSIHKVRDSAFLQVLYWDLLSYFHNVLFHNILFLVEFGTYILCFRDLYVSYENRKIFVFIQHKLHVRRFGFIHVNFLFFNPEEVFL